MICAVKNNWGILSSLGRVVAIKNVYREEHEKNSY
jgi:hypothetical protein